MHKWYTRPILFVDDIARALYFYVDMLGFEKAWHEADGKGGVCQVYRAECEIILCRTLDAEIVGASTWNLRELESTSLNAHLRNAQLPTGRFGGDQTRFRLTTQTVTNSYSRCRENRRMSGLTIGSSDRGSTISGEPGRSGRYG